MVIVKFRPRWPHTLRYALHSLSRPTMTSGRKGKCIAAAVDEHTVAKYGVILYTNSGQFWGEIGIV